MRRATRILMLAAAGLLLTAAAATAQVPTNMNVQGRLTDAAGDPVPPGLKIFTFKIFDAEVAGTEIWPAGAGENQTLNTNTDGLWSTRVGEIIALPVSVFADSARWLQITVDDGINPPETLSRVKLNTNPYAYVAGSLSANAAAGLDADYVNVSGDVMTGSLQVPYLEIGHPFSAGLMFLYGGSHSQPFIWAYDFYGHGGAVEIWTDDDDQVIQMQADANGEGGFFRVNGPTSLFQVDGKFGPAPDSNMMITIAGPSSQARFNTNTTGDDFLELPKDAVSAAEILNEPGITQGIVKNNSINVTGTTTMTDVVTTSISIPAAGYIVVEATGMAWLDIATPSDVNYLLYQIDQTSGGSPDANYSQYAGFSTSPTTNSIFMPIYANRTYYKAAAATYIFRLEAMDGLSTASGYRRVWNPSIRATYYPTSYGTVSTVATQDEAAQFESAELIRAAAEAPDGSAAGGAAYRVDLRELELKAARAEAEAERLRREVAEARAARQDQISEAKRNELR